MQLSNSMFPTQFRIQLQYWQVFVCVAWLLLLSGLVHAQESPAESYKTLRPAEGVEVSLWANEPLVNNPTSMDID